MLEAARGAGIYVPTLCDFSQLMPHGSCRMCSVEIEGSRRLSIACATPALDGMVVKTETEALTDLRRKILQLVFSERNHYCMFCEMSGECELQSLAYRYQVDHFKYRFMYPKLEVDSSHRYFIYDPNRCILCTRCVRACSELVANGTLGLMRRGAATMVDADINQPFGKSSCVSCGTCVQVCPTGALYERRGAYGGKTGESTTIQTTCPGCDLGCPVNVVSRSNRVLHIKGDFSSSINRGLLCERGRYQPLQNMPDRYMHPLIRKGGRLEKATLEEALSIVVEQLRARVKPNGGSPITGVVSPRAANEAIYLFQKLFRTTLNSNSLITLGEESPEEYSFTASYTGASLADVESADHIVVIGTDLTRQYQVLGFAIKRAVRKGATLTLIAGAENALANQATMCLVPSHPEYGAIVNGFMHAIVTSGLAKRAVEHRTAFMSLLQKYSAPTVATHTGLTEAQLKEAATIYAKATRPVIVWSGADDRLELAALSLATITGNYDGQKARILRLGDEVNSRGAREMGGTAAYLPGRITWSSPLVQRFADIWGSPLPHPHNEAAPEVVYFLLSDETAPPDEAMLRLARRAGFVVLHSAYRSPLEEAADVVLPAPTWAEKDGSLTSADGTIRRLNPAVNLPADIHEDWEVLSELLTMLGRLRGYRSADEVFAEISRAVPSYGERSDLPSSAFMPSCVEF